MWVEFKNTGISQQHWLRSTNHKKIWQFKQDCQSITIQHISYLVSWLVKYILSNEVPEYDKWKVAIFSVYICILCCFICIVNNNKIAFYFFLEFNNFPLVISKFTEQNKIEYKWKLSTQL